MVDSGAVISEPLAFVLELVWPRFELHLERPAAGKERVVDTALVGVVHVG